jgi:L,D-transpeptidase catalytic domain
VAVLRSLTAVAVATVSSFVPAYATSGGAAPDRAGSGFTLGGLSPNVFEMAMGAASCAVRSGEVGQPDTLTVIDYSRPSTEKRLWVFDLRSRRLLYQELVAHGQGSGENMAVTFSNDTDSHRSSLGLFVTGDPYVGKNGYSLRLDGLEDGINDRARERGIVLHGAPYVSADFAQLHGRLGRSWGCPALREAVARNVIDRVKGGGLLFVYYPDPEWLESSKYLACEK